MMYTEQAEVQIDREIHCGNCNWEGDIVMWVDWGVATGECRKCRNDIVIDLSE